jgi:hypothetical protein
MPEMTLTEAAQWAGKDRTTVFKAIQKGRISARKTLDGTWMIETSELGRLYRPAAPVNESLQRQDNSNDVTALREIITILQKQLEDTQSQRDRLLGVVETQTRLIAGQRSSWWQRLTGKS